MAAEEQYLKKYYALVAKIVTKKQRKDKREAQPVEAKGPHINRYSQFNSILWKSTEYAQRGSDYIERDGNRHEVYQSFPHTALAFRTSVERILRRNARYPGGVKGNFQPKVIVSIGDTKKKANQGYPYKWAAHHILPLSAFYYKSKSGKPVFTGKHRDLLLMADFDLNHGHNIIHLPRAGANWAVPVHSLIQHPSDHPKYTQFVIKQLEKIVESLDKIINNKKPHQAVEVNLLNELRGLEDDLWNYLVQLSRKAVSDKLNMQSATTEDGLVVDYQTWCKLS